MNIQCKSQCFESDRAIHKNAHYCCWNAPILTAANRSWVHTYLGCQKLKAFSHAVILICPENMKESFWSMEMFLVSFLPQQDMDRAIHEFKVMFSCQGSICCWFQVSEDISLSVCLSLSLLKDLTSLHQVVFFEESVFPFLRKGIGHQQLLFSTSEK